MSRGVRTLARRARFRRDDFPLMTGSPALTWAVGYEHELARQAGGRARQQPVGRESTCRQNVDERRSTFLTRSHVGVLTRFKRGSEKHSPLLAHSAPATGFQQETSAAFPSRDLPGDLGSEAPAHYRGLDGGTGAKGRTKRAHVYPSGCPPSRPHPLPVTHTSGCSPAWHPHAPSLTAALAPACRAHVTRATVAAPPCVSPPGPHAPAPAPAAASVPTSGPVPCSLCLDTCESRGGVPTPLPVTPPSCPPLPAPSCPSPPPAPSLDKDVAWHPAGAKKH